MAPLRLIAFDMNCVGHIQQGLWRHPRDRSTDYTGLDHWVELARLLERGLFDGLFLADVLGIYDVYDASPDEAIRHAVQVPVNDPLLLVPAMAHATTHLGFGVTANLSYEPPYVFARRMSTLDHLTKGRIGWNIVTGYLNSAARAMGLAHQVAHDDRYDVADDYMAAVYKLWEGSWADDAVRADRTGGTYADPTRVRAVHHARPAFHARWRAPRPSRRRSAPRCCSRPAARTAAGASPGSTPNACSSTAAPRPPSPPMSAPSARPPPPPAARLPTSRSLSAPASSWPRPRRWPTPNSPTTAAPPRPRPRWSTPRPAWASTSPHTAWTTRSRQCQPRRSPATSPPWRSSG